MTIIALLLTLSSMPHVRTADPAVRQLLAHGLAESAEFRALIDAIERTDVIVHIERQPLTGRSLAAMTRFVTRAGGVRYLRITLDPRVSGQMGVTLLGHELQHAKEIARAEWVTDGDALLRLLEQIGYRIERTHSFDTSEAVRVSRVVAHQLRVNRALAIRGER